LVNIENSLVKPHDPLPSRIFKFPVLLEDPIFKVAVADYTATVRSSAVYLPDNMDYIAKSNGVCDRETASRSIVACPQ
jgi:urea carboxylase